VGDGEALAAQQPPDPDMGVEQNLHRRASKAWASSTESSGSIANTPDPRNFSQGRWLGEGPPFAILMGSFACQPHPQQRCTADHPGQHGLDRVVRVPAAWAASRADRGSAGRAWLS
jgi:hypothetical protein